MIHKIFGLCLTLFIVLHLAESSPHLYRRHHSYYHNSPYHVAYNPYSLPKRNQYFGVESPIYNNDLDDNLSNEPVKGGVKNTNQNPTIKTPMKLFSERKNGYLSSSLDSFQEKYQGVKRANAGSIKQSPIIYPNPEFEPNESTVHLPVLDLNEKIVENEGKKGSSDPKSKISKPKLASSTTTQAPEPSSSKGPVVIENNVKQPEPAISSSEPLPAVVVNEANLDVKTNVPDNKSPTAEQPTTLSSVNVVDSTEVKESVSLDSKNVVKSDDVLKIQPNVVKSDETLKVQSDVVKSTVETEVAKVDSPVVKPEEASKKPEEVISSNVQETPVASEKVGETVSNKVVETAVVDSKEVESNVKDPLVESKPVIMKDATPAVESSILDVRNKVNTEKPALDQVSSVSTEAVQGAVDAPKNEVNVIPDVVPETIASSPVVEENKVVDTIKVASVDVAPSPNTENSLALESETSSPLVN